MADLEPANFSGLQNIIIIISMRVPTVVAREIFYNYLRTDYRNGFFLIINYAVGDRGVFMNRYELL